VTALQTERAAVSLDRAQIFRRKPAV